MAAVLISGLGTTLQACVPLIALIGTVGARKSEFHPGTARRLGPHHVPLLHLGHMPSCHRFQVFENSPADHRSPRLVTQAERAWMDPHRPVQFDRWKAPESRHHEVRQGTHAIAGEGEDVALVQGLALEELMYVLAVVLSPVGVVSFIDHGTDHIPSHALRASVASAAVPLHAVDHSSRPDEVK